MLVLTYPGQTALILIYGSVLAYAKASDFVSPIIACLLAEYKEIPAPPLSPKTLDKFIIL